MELIRDGIKLMVQPANPIAAAFRRTSHARI